MQPVAVRTVAPSKTATILLVTIRPSSFEVSGDPGSEADVTCIVLTFRAVDRSYGLCGEDLLTVFGVKLACYDR
jgi:hypothetical protein